MRRDLALDTSTLATMARVCRALDGMPLAIELAAARLRTMSIDQLASRLDDRFRLLTSGSRTALPRHRTLRAMVDWSWELLTDAERMVLRRLSVFSGGASLEAAERVCAGDAVEQDQVLDLLTALTEKSLLRNDGGNAPHYRMSGTIMEYAGQRLAAAGEADLARHAHLAYFTELAEIADPQLRRAEQLNWLATLEAEHDNIGAAMRGALAAGEAHVSDAARGGRGLVLVARRAQDRRHGAPHRGHRGARRGDRRGPGHGVRAARAVRERWAGRRAPGGGVGPRGVPVQPGQPAPPPGAGVVAALERMLQAPDAFLTVWELLLGDQDPWVRAIARLQLGKMRIMLGQGGREADVYLETALAEFRALGERFGISFALTELADRIAMRGELAAACEHYEQAIAVLTEIGPPRTSSSSGHGRLSCTGCWAMRTPARLP